MGTHSKFLAQGITTKKAFLRREVRIDAAIFYLRKGLRDFRSQRALIIGLSQDGCTLTCPAPFAVHDHLYLVASKLPKTACAVVDRSDTTLDLRFSSELPAPVFNGLSARRVPPATAPQNV